MCVGNSNRRENSKHSEATLDIEDILDKGVKEGGQGLGVRSENGPLTGRWEEWNAPHGRQILAGQHRNNEARGIKPTGPFLKPSYLPYLIQIRLRGHPKISFLKQGFLCLNLLGRKGGKVKSSSWVFCFSRNSLKSTSQKAASGWQNFGLLQVMMMMMMMKRNKGKQPLYLPLVVLLTKF